MELIESNWGIYDWYRDISDSLEEVVFAFSQKICSRSRTRVSKAFLDDWRLNKRISYFTYDYKIILWHLMAT